MEYVSYETTVIMPPGEVQGYWTCSNCGHVIYNFGQRPLIYNRIEKRTYHLLRELEDEIEKVRKWMRGKDVPPEIMKLFERTRKREIWTI